MLRGLISFVHQSQPLEEENTIWNVGGTVVLGLSILSIYGITCPIFFGPWNLSWNLTSPLWLKENESISWSFSGGPTPVDGHFIRLTSGKWKMNLAVLLWDTETISSGAKSIKIWSKNQMLDQSFLSFWFISTWIFTYKSVVKNLSKSCLSHGRWTNGRMRPPAGKMDAFFSIGF